MLPKKICALQASRDYWYIYLVSHVTIAHSFIATDAFCCHVIISRVFAADILLNKKNSNTYVVINTDDINIMVKKDTFIKNNNNKATSSYSTIIKVTIKKHGVFVFV